MTSCQRRLRQHLCTVEEITKCLFIIIVVFKSFFVSAHPKYLKKLFSLRSFKYFLRGNNVLSSLEPRTTTYGLESIKHEAAKLWNSLKVDFH